MILDASFFAFLLPLLVVFLSQQCINYWYCQLQGNWKINDVRITSCLMIACGRTTFFIWKKNIDCTLLFHKNIYPLPKYQHCQSEYNWTKNYRNGGDDGKPDPGKSFGEWANRRFFSRLSQYCPKENVTSNFQSKQIFTRPSHWHCANAMLSR